MKKILLTLLCLMGFTATWAATTVTTTVKDYASLNSWSNGTQYTTMKLDENVTITVTGNTNSGKYYTSGSEWRLYQTESAKLTIAVPDGYTLNSTTITYTISNKGTLLNSSDETVTSGVAQSISGESVTFHVGNSGSASNGQVKITAISVTYEEPAGAIVKPVFSVESGIVATGTTVNLSTTTDGATIYYASETELGTSNPTADEIVTINHNATSFVVNSTEKYFAVAKLGEDLSGISSATYTVLAHAGTEADPYNVADAIVVANANGTSSSTDVYVTGYVAKINSATVFFITDAEDGTGDQLEIYNVSIPSSYTYELYDKVVVCAPLMMYKTTPETNGGNLISVTSKPECRISYSTDEFTYVIGTNTVSDLPVLSNPNSVDVTYVSSDTDVASVDANGVVTVNAQGATIITASFAGNSTYKAGNAEYTLVVDDPSITTLECVVDFSEQKAQSYTKNGEIVWTAENNVMFTTSATVSGNSTYPRINTNLRIYKSSNNIITVTAPTDFYFSKATFETIDGSSYTANNMTLTIGSTDEANSFTENEAVYLIANPTNVFKINCNNGTNNSSDISKITLVICKYSAGVVFVDAEPYGNTVATDCGSVEYLREFTNTNWQAWYAPFAVSSDNFEAAIELTGAVVATNTLQFTTVTGTLTGNKTYLVKPKAADIVNIPAVDGNILAAASEEVTFNGYTLAGTYDKKTNLMTAGVYAIAADGNFHPASNNAVVLNPFRIFLKVPTPISTPVRITIDDEEVTGIEDVLYQLNEDGCVYDLQGRRVDNPGNGIFIVNGKKTYINK